MTKIFASRLSQVLDVEMALWHRAVNLAPGHLKKLICQSFVDVAHQTIIRLDLTMILQMSLIRLCLSVEKYSSSAWNGSEDVPA